MITKLSIVIPTYNEEKTIHNILDKVLAVKLINGIKKELIIVNDCSKDATLQVLNEYCKNHSDADIKVLHHEINKGKGAALHTGISYATGEYLIIQDADMEYDPREYNDLLKPIVEGFADVVFGSRFLGGNPHRILFFWHSIGNRLLTLLSNMFTNLNLSDMETCYKLFRTDIIQSIELKENRFGFEPEVTAKISRVPNIRIYEVGISYYGRTYEEGKKIGWKDGFRAIYSILKYNVFDKTTYKNEEHKNNIITSKTSRKWLLLLFLSVFGYFSYLSIYNNKNVPNWQSEIWSDKAGYYIYLPSTFIYGFSINNFPDKIAEQCGGGFYFNKEGKLFTKYMSGVAILILPFFLILHLLLLLFGYNATGFSPPYHILVNITSAFYLALGVIALYKFMKNYLNVKISLFTIIILLFSTNLYYYAAYETLMSHVYSFSIFSIFLFVLKKYLDFKKTKYLFITGFTFALATLIRPTNIYIILLIFFLDIKSISDLKERIFHFSKPLRILVFIICFVLVFLPQITYWKYITGHFFLYSYSNEGFTFWNNPKILEILFSPLNGLFLYNPSYLIILIGLVFSSFKYKLNGFIGIFSFLFITYTSASWYSYFFGCGFGLRTFVEYNALFALPFGYFLNYIFSKKGFAFKSFITLLLIYSTYFSINIENIYDRCFFGTQWDWGAFKIYIEKAKIFPFAKSQYNWNSNFENNESNQATFFRTNLNTIHPFKKAFSGNNVSIIDSVFQYSAGFNAYIAAFSPNNIKKVNVEAYVYSKNLPKELRLVCNSDNNEHKDIYYDAPRIDNIIKENNKWYKVEGHFNINKVVTKYHTLSVFIYSPAKDTVYIDNLNINVEY